MSCVLVTEGSSCKRQQQQRSITNSNHLHQADGAAGAIAEFHLTLSCCVFASVGHSCKQQQQHRSQICIRLMSQLVLLLNLTLPPLLVCL